MLKGPNNDLANVRHLLRNLDNPRALRRNPLVAHFFAEFAGENESASVRRIGGTLSAAIDSLKPTSGITRSAIHSQRQHTIITRYDIGGESIDAIAADLGIARSKYFYERRAALGRIADMLNSHKRVAAQGFALASNKTDAAQRYAMKLRKAGQFNLSIAVYRDLIAAAQGDAQRTILLCHLVATLCDAGDVAGAINALAGARSIRVRHGHDDLESAVVNAELDLAALQVSWYLGKVRNALKIGTQRLEALKAPGTQPEALETLFCSLGFWVGAMQTQSGMLSAGVASFKEALKHCNFGRSVSQLLRAESLAILANAQILSVSEMGLASKTNAEAFDLATEDCFLQTLADVHLNQAMMLYWSGDLQSALKHATQAQAIADAADGPVGRGRASLQLARVEAACGKTDAALQRIGEARSSMSEGTHLWIVSHIIESELFGERKAYVSALRAAEVAAEFSQQTGNYLTLGRALLRMAETHELLGNRPEALEAITTSVPTLEAHGDAFSLRRGFQCSARLTGSRRHRLNATDLTLAIKGLAPQTPLTG